MSARYRLPDEPMPGGLSRYAVDPMWPLLALMLAGNGFGLAWFAFNSVALGSPSRNREWMYAAFNLLGSAVLVLLLAMASGNGWLDASALRYAGLSLIALKLICGYSIYLSQQRSCELWEHFGGKPANGLPVVILLAMFGHRLLGPEFLPPLLLGVLQ